jgi:hypothetical protein
MGTAKIVANKAIAVIKVNIFGFMLPSCCA